MSLLLAVAFVPEPEQSRIARPDTNPPPDPQLNENVVKVPVTLTLPDGTLHKSEFVLTTFRPDGPGPFPAVVVSHGRDASPKARAEFGRAEYGASSWMYHYWTLRGFAVLAPTRVGYGVSGTDVDPETARGPCDSLDFATAASAVTAHIRATIEYAATQAWIDKDNIVLAGESAGGFGSIIAAGQRLPGVKAAVNFAGGAAGLPHTRPEQPCSPQNVELLLVQAARQGAVPSIWFYAENDRFWGAKLPRTWHTAYVGAGGTAEFHMLPPLREDGHGVVPYGFEHWPPRLDRFLSAMGYAPRKLPWGAPQPTGFAPLERSPPVANLSAWCMGAYDRFLTLADLPRAFAISPNGGCTYSWGALDVMASFIADRIGRLQTLFAGSALQGVVLKLQDSASAWMSPHKRVGLNQVISALDDGICARTVCPMERAIQLVEISARESQLILFARCRSSNTFSMWARHCPCCSLL